MEMEIGDLPGELLSYIISLTSPRDACRLALVSSRFRLAFDSDVVWEKFLPSGYEALISQADTIPEATRFGRKKALYFYLCNNPIRIGNGNMSFSIDRESGKICIMVGARGHSIAWGDAPQYWQWIPAPELAGPELAGPEFAEFAGPEFAEFAGPEFVGPELAGPESRFPEVARLRYVWWLQLSARVDTRILSPQTTYEAYLVFNFAPNGHNFQNLPVQLRVDFEGREDGEGLNVVLDAPNNDGEDGWKWTMMGEFFNDGREGGFVVCSVKEVDNFRIKSGLILEGIVLRPRHV